MDASTSITGQKCYGLPDNHVKLSIKSFKMPELVIDIPESATVGSLKIVAVCGLQQSTQETEEALSHAMEALHWSLEDAVVSDALSCPLNMPNYMAQMAIAMDKLTT
ncbi:bZIP transcription factor TGA10 isoform X1 [Canna indica]|uniref:BZIP transcription factor TGA10 isoform X1 n=1 Tax=Canna indica TaxID=4628 RepID=A0AAQ3QQM6_9LILI|nr:bZIP transcription factor TGA10 isoform X1 [Canna indica]